MSDPDLDRARRILSDVLYSANDRHELPARDVEEQCAEFDVTLNLLQRAKRSLNIRSDKAKGVNDGPWLWRLPESYEPSAAQRKAATAQPPAAPWIHSFTPCWGCDKPIPATTANTGTAANGDVTYGFCDECKAKKRRTDIEALERGLEWRRKEHGRITAPGLSSGDPNAADLAGQIGPLERRLELLHQADMEAELGGRTS